MTSHEIQKSILIALKHGRLDHFQVAADICQAPFRVRAELKTLKREHLVREHWTAKSVLFELTSLGYEAAFAADQTTLTIRKERIA